MTILIARKYSDRVEIVGDYLEEIEKCSNLPIEDILIYIAVQKSLIPILRVTVAPGETIDSCIENPSFKGLDELFNNFAVSGYGADIAIGALEMGAAPYEAAQLIFKYYGYINDLNESDSPELFHRVIMRNPDE
jgi:hypothetical protein